MTIYLKATDEATFNQALVDAGWSETVEVPSEDDEVTEQVNYILFNETHSLDVIGTIYAETGNTLTTEENEFGDTFEYPETAPIDGYHANLLLHGEEMPEALAGFVIEAPTTPARRFA